MTRRAWSRAAVLPVAVAVLVSAGGVAYAVTRAQAGTPPLPVGPVLTFGAQVQTQAVPAAAPSGPYSMTFKAITNNGVGNIGTSQFAALRATPVLNVSSATMTVQATASDPAASIAIEVCDGASYTSAGTCPAPGKVLSIAAAASMDGTLRRFPVPAALPWPTSSKVVEVKVSNVLKTIGFTVALGLEVSRAQTTPGAQTTSS